MNSRDQLRTQLLASMAAIFSGEASPVLLGALRVAFPELSFALVVNWIPEQAEDIYWILIDLDRIAMVEVPRLSDNISDVLIEIVSLTAYKERRLSVENRMKLKVAIELMKRHEGRGFI